MQCGQQDFELIQLSCVQNLFQTQLETKLQNWHKTRFKKQQDNFSKQTCKYCILYICILQRIINHFLSNIKKKRIQSGQTTGISKAKFEPVICDGHIY